MRGRSHRAVAALLLMFQFSSVQLLSRVRLFATPWSSAYQASPSITNSSSVLKLTCIVSVMPSNHLILCCPLLLPPSIFPSIRVFSNKLVLHIKGPKYRDFSFGISPSNEYSGLISFRIDWLDPLAVQGTLKSLLQHHSSKASILRCSAFFMVKLSHPYMTTGKTIALTRWTFVDTLDGPMCQTQCWNTSQASTHYACNPLGVGIVFIPILQMWKLRYQKVKLPA